MKPDETPAPVTWPDGCAICHATIPPGQATQVPARGRAGRDGEMRYLCPGCAKIGVRPK